MGQKGSRDYDGDGYREEPKEHTGNASETNPSSTKGETSVSFSKSKSKKEIHRTVVSEPDEGEKQFSAESKPGTETGPKLSLQKEFCRDGSNFLQRDKDLKEDEFKYAAGNSDLVNTELSSDTVKTSDETDIEYGSDECTISDIGIGSDADETVLAASSTGMTKRTVPYTSTNHLQKAVDTVIRATNEDKNRNYEAAIKLYQEAILYFFHALKYEAQSDKARESIRTKCLTYLDRAEKLKNFIENRRKPKNSRQTDSGDDNDDTTRKEFNTVLSDAYIKNPGVKWDEIVGQDNAKTVLQETLILPRKFPHLFTGHRKPWKRILLYGPPGVGKSLLVKAVATEADRCAFFSIRAEDLQSKWIGETERNIRRLFRRIREHQFCILFVDDLENIFPRSTDNNKEHFSRIRAEFNIQIHNLLGDTGDVTIIAATELPWELDVAVMRKFEKLLYVPLLLKQDRLSLLRRQIGQTPHALSDEDFCDLAEKTEGYSCADIVKVTREALFQPIKKVQRATHFRKVQSFDLFEDDEDLWTPCSPEEEGAIEMDWTKIDADNLLEPRVSKADFLMALAKNKPTAEEYPESMYARFA